ncbi:hypothetical protein BGZ63DRAFT_225719 [Mariannaea sp. PMI_226]|nr:hypothetical protein BGZ63DRAFT_225719 [Mariannaea sp. PMI_226]
MTCKKSKGTSSGDGPSLWRLHIVLPIVLAASPGPYLAAATGGFHQLVGHGDLDQSTAATVSIVDVLKALRHAPVHYGGNSGFPHTAVDDTGQPPSLYHRA